MRLRFYDILFDGLRGYYCSYSRERNSAGYSAAATLSFLFSINLMGGAVIAAFLASGDLSHLDGLFDHRLILLPIGVAIFAAHVLYAKSTSSYDSKEPCRVVNWQRLMWAYVGVTGFIFVSAMACALASRTKG